MKKKMMKAIRDLNAYIDDDRQKLCDELHEVKLSHKRMERLLRRTLDYIDSLGFIESDNGDCTALYESIERELLYPYYRVNWKVKGGKDA